MEKNGGRIKKEEGSGRGGVDISRIVCYIQIIDLPTKDNEVG